MNDLPDPRKIEEILSYTVQVLQDSKHQMFDIVETAQAEHNRVILSIKDLTREVHLVIQQVEDLEKDFKNVRIRLVEVSRDFEKFDEEERRDVYQKADRIREILAAARERERHLHERRQEQEQALVRVAGLVEKAERSVGQMGVALDFLRGNLDEINLQLEGIQARYQLGQKIIRMQEDERKRVARDIHDGPAQDLANVVLKAEICEQLFHTCRTDDLLSELGELKQSVKDSLQEVRKIIHNLRPMVLDDLGLVPAVKRLVEEVRAQSDIQLELDVLGNESRLDSAIEVAVYRVIQEAISNSRKHAFARKVQVKIEFLPELVNAAIEDDGVGFNLAALHEQLATGKHFGLYGMNERIELLGGSMNVYSEKGFGTRIGVRIPLNTGKEKS